MIFNKFLCCVYAYAKIVLKTNKKIFLKNELNEPYKQTSNAVFCNHKNWNDIKPIYFFVVYHWVDTIQVSVLYLSREHRII